MTNEVGEKQLEWYREGFRRGGYVACDFYVYTDERGNPKLDANGDVQFLGPDSQDTMLFDDAYLAALETEEMDRDYSPFEMVAHSINSDPDADDLWEAFNQGISDGVYDHLSRKLAPHVARQ